MSYPSERLAEEVAYLAYYLHWPHDQLLNLDHHERRMWVEHVGSIHARMEGER